MTTNTQSKEESITEDEAALYDRQIRLWGLDAQKRLRAASILLIGLRGLGAEVAKNIVLAGVKSVTLLDSTVADDEDMASQFLIPRSEIGKNRAQASLERTQQLNPMVHVTVDTESIDDKDDDFIASFDVVCATGCGVSTLKHLDALCRSHGVKFYAGDVFGFYGFMFADLGTHHYADVTLAIGLGGCMAVRDLLRRRVHNKAVANASLERNLAVSGLENMFQLKENDPASCRVAVDLKELPTCKECTVFREITKPKAVPKLSADEHDGEPARKKMKAEEPETVTVRKVMEFPSLDTVLKVRFDCGSPDGKKKLKQIPNTYFITRALLDFIEEEKRHPRTSSLENDQSLLDKIRQSSISDSGVDEGKFQEDFSKFCFGQLSPVCAIVGGILGQEIIKAVSQKDAPHKNFFFYNGTDDGGIVITVGS